MRETIVLNIDITRNLGCLLFIQLNAQVDWINKRRDKIKMHGKTVKKMVTWKFQAYDSRMLKYFVKKLELNTCNLLEQLRTGLC